MDLNEYEKIQYPLSGIPIAELVAALSVVAAAAPAPIGETRVLQMDTRREGYLHVQTGIQSRVRAGSGKHILLKRTDDGWVVVEIGTWRS